MCVKGVSPSRRDSGGREAQDHAASPAPSTPRRSFFLPNSPRSRGRACPNPPPNTLLHRFVTRGPFSPPNSRGHHRHNPDCVAVFEIVAYSKTRTIRLSLGSREHRFGGTFVGGCNVRSYTRRVVVGFRDRALEGDVRRLGVLDPPPTSILALLVAPAPMEPRTSARVTVGKQV